MTTDLGVHLGGTDLGVFIAACIGRVLFLCCLFFCHLVCFWFTGRDGTFALPHRIIYTLHHHYRRRRQTSLAFVGKSFLSYTFALPFLSCFVCGTGEWDMDGTWDGWDGT